MMRSVAVRLTLVYLAIIMALSIGFSVVIYRISARELARSPGMDNRLLVRFATPMDELGFETMRQERAREAQHNLQRNLIFLNIGTLVLGAAASYVLARRTLQPIEEAFEAQGRFTADASHELRTPLTAMRTSIEVGLRNPKLTLPKSKELLESTLDEVNKLSMLSNGLLKLTRSNGQDMPKMPVSVQKIASESVSQLSLAATHKSITLRQDVDDVSVLGDAVHLKEVITILLDNAIKYGNSDSTVTVAAKATGKHVIVSVADQGPGIKASDLVHIFDRFYRADTARSRDQIEGYGLGLSIAKKIVESHEGTIEAKSKLGEGTTFIVKLPLA